MLCVCLNQGRREKDRKKRERAKERKRYLTCENEKVEGVFEGVLTHSLSQNDFVSPLPPPRLLPSLCQGFILLLSLSPSFSPSLSLPPSLPHSLSLTLSLAFFFASTLSSPILFPFFRVWISVRYVAGQSNRRSLYISHDIPKDIILSNIFI